MKKEIKRIFERETKDWGLCFDKDKKGEYIDFQTGASFALFMLGWVAATEYEKGSQ